MNADALETTVIALKLRPEHAALVEAAKRLAEALDIDENAANASLWARYQEAITALLDAVPHEAEDDGHATLIELVRPKVRNPKNTGAKVTGTRRRSGGKKLGQPTHAVATPGRGRGSGAPA